MNTQIARLIIALGAVVIHVARNQPTPGCRAVKMQPVRIKFARGAGTALTQWGRARLNMPKATGVAAATPNVRRHIGVTFSQPKHKGTADPNLRQGCSAVTTPNANLIIAIAGVTEGRGECASHSMGIADMDRRNVPKVS